MYFTKKNNSLNPIDNFESNCTDGFSVFKDCPSEIKNQIKKNAQLKSFNRGEKLFNVGDAAAGFFFIQSGTVKISKKGKRNKEFILWLA
ncbi:MAG: cyclic nucleotide-binding domain-containing protein [Bacteroidia bacterium]|nr:cyclic nucleotide-binding domain-containing protein [Bacteroidia bacterium]